MLQSSNPMSSVHKIELLKARALQASLAESVPAQLDANEDHEHNRILPLEALFT